MVKRTIKELIDQLEQYRSEYKNLNDLKYRNGPQTWRWNELWSLIRNLEGYIDQEIELEQIAGMGVQIISLFTERKLI